MVRNDNTISKNDKDSIEYYKDILKAFVIDQSEALPTSDQEINKYIAAFSLYIRNSDSAYRYNLPYLTYQHNKFVVFLRNARYKCDLLRNAVCELRKSPNILSYLNNKEKETNKITISINDFFVSDLNGIINFHEAFSINGAERHNSDNLFTIQYESNGTRRLRTCKIPVASDNTHTIDYTKFIQLVEKIIGVCNVGLGGSSNEGNNKRKTIK